MALKMLSLLLAVIFVLTFMGIFWMIYAVKAKSSKNGSVISYRRKCARIGGNILKMNGSAVDSAIATLVCEGVHQPQKIGIGGGFLALIYSKSSASSEALIAIEGVPSKATADMFMSHTLEDRLTIAVPAEIRIYYALHKKYGRLKWADLLKPSIKICKKGYRVDEELANDLKEQENDILKVASLKDFFVNQSTGNVFNKGDIIQDELLAETLTTIARHGESAIYHGGSIGRLLVEDVRKLGGILTEEDLKRYKPYWNQTLQTKYSNYTIHTTPVAGSEVLVKFIQNPPTEDPSDFDFQMKDPERFKMMLPIIPELIERKVTRGKLFRRYHPHIKFHRFQDGKTFNVLEYYTSSDSASKVTHGYAISFVAVIAPTGDAIAVTSSLHSRFGSMRRSSSTGIMLNDLMRNSYFRNLGQKDPSISVLVDSVNSPIFSFFPTIITDVNGYPKMVLSSCGDVNTTYSLAEIIRKNLEGLPKGKLSLFKTMRRL